MNCKNILTLILLFCASVINAQNNNSQIIIKKDKAVSQLLIDGKPFLMLGGELGNSSASEINYLKPTFPYLKKMNLNTVLAPVYWELLEPEENKFDFSLVDGMIEEARKQEMKLVFLWFGTWKNSMSCYAPSWMKTNSKRFPRTYDSLGRSHEIFSVFGKETLQADKKAFTALIKHIRETDSQQHTVIMVQVENEIGMLTTAREISKAANSRFNSPVPGELTAWLSAKQNELVPELKSKWQKQGSKTKGTWAEVFGNDIYTEEIFQAWHYAKYTNEVATAGKKEYNLPMFVNAALPRPGKIPGQYPSAGPLPHLMDIWQAAAPSLDMLSPDFYNPDTKYWCDLYNRNGNTLFVPEIQFDKTVAAKAFFIIGHYKALGFSPFSIESENKASAALAKSYEVLNQLTPAITGKRWLNMDGFLLDKQNKKISVKMGDYNITVSHEGTLPWSSEAKDSVWSTTGGIILQTAENEFLLGGTGLVVTFENISQDKVTNFLKVDEIKIQDGKEIFVRRLNGDQDHQGRHARVDSGDWQIQRIILYNSPAKID